MTTEHVDVLIIGAGLSGISAAHHLQTACPGHSYAILEGRAAIGGTWDLFRYPGVRSDSDMHTLGYRFRPWDGAKAIADGPAILQYIRDTARDADIERRIRFGHRVTAAAWSSADARWTVQVERDGQAQPQRLCCSFLFLCSGYYRYDAGYTPELPGLDRFAGRVVHPQHWTADVDYAGKDVVVIGSGATAVTLVPELARTARHVTMLQRSPTYVVARPSVDAIADRLRRWLPRRLAYAATRWKNVLLGMYVYRLCKREPARMKRFLIGGVRQALGREYDVAKHFTPRYNPWEQRLCLVPDGDLFASIRSGRASVVTDEIDGFDAAGIRLRSGARLDADLVVTATGLNLQVLGGLRLSVDGAPVDSAGILAYRGLMFEGLPNLASSFGYTNASWTLKCDLGCEYVCRLLNHMRRRGYTHCTPRNRDPAVTAQPWVDFSSGYFQRALHLLPSQGSRPPWRLHQNYIRDIWLLRRGRLEDGVLEFARAA